MKYVAPEDKEEKKRTEQPKILKGLSDKILHCLARTIQDEMYGTNVRCMYCKYAIECSVAWQKEKSKKLLFMEILRELGLYTGVNIFLQPESATKAILKGSWVEKYPDILKMLMEKSFEEQQDFMRYSDIIQQLIEEADKNV